MTFRRPKDDADKARKWRDFTASERDLFNNAGLPQVLSDDRALFDQFLMHGFLEMPGGLADGTRFSDDELDVSQREALDRLVDFYVELFGDPGVSLGPRPS